MKETITILSAIKTPKDVITDWLTLLANTMRSNGLPEGYHYAGIGDFLMRHGTWYEPRPLPSRIKRRMSRRCFHNSLELSLKLGYTYVEGYAVPDIENLFFPAHHAWNLDRNGNLIDSTWGDRTGLAYFGVAFPRDVAKDAISNDGNTVLDNPHSRFELFKTPFCEVA